MALLSQSLVPLRTGEIAEAVQREINIDRRTVERALGRLAQSGKLSRPKKGYYESDGIEDATHPTDPRSIYPPDVSDLSDEGGVRPLFLSLRGCLAAAAISHFISHRINPSTPHSRCLLAQSFSSLNRPLSVFPC